MRGELPWTKIDDKSQKDLILELKSYEKINDLCKECPEQICDLLKYVKSLKFDEAPDYDFFNMMFQSIAIDAGIDHTDIQLLWSNSENINAAIKKSYDNDITKIKKAKNSKEELSQNMEVIENKMEIKDEVELKKT